MFVGKFEMSGKRRKRVAKKGCTGKTAESSSSSAEEDSSTPAQGQLSTLAEALVDALSEMEAQIASTGNESAPSETNGAVSRVLERLSAEAQKLKDAHAAFKRKLQEMELQATSSQKSTNQFENTFRCVAGD